MNNLSKFIASLGILGALYSPNVLANDCNQRSPDFLNRLQDSRRSGLELTLDTNLSSIPKIYPYSRDTNGDPVVTLETDGLKSESELRVDGKSGNFGYGAGINFIIPRTGDVRNLGSRIANMQSEFKKHGVSFNLDYDILNGNGLSLGAGIDYNSMEYIAKTLSDTYNINEDSVIGNLYVLADQLKLGENTILDGFIKGMAELSHNTDNLSSLVAGEAQRNKLGIKGEAEFSHQFLHNDIQNSLGAYKLLLDYSIKAQNENRTYLGGTLGMKAPFVTDGNKNIDFEEYPVFTNEFGARFNIITGEGRPIVGYTLEDKKFKAGLYFYGDEVEVSGTYKY